ncbi:MAG: ABC transporter substrate-binding protein [Actinobacteria bacterium]|nr:ABC transporter substrate-binding protein [Actinomycetota bacterium]
MGKMRGLPVRRGSNSLGFRSCSGRPMVSLIAVLSIGILLSACSNAKAVYSKSGNTNGVYPHKIVVGALASLTGPVPAAFAPAIDGAKAYFDMINARGGVDGRHIDLAYVLDDASNPAQDTDQARTLVEQDHVFAVVPVATPSFSGATYLTSHDVPTFGYAVTSQWDGPKNLFAYDGYVNFSYPDPDYAFVAQQLGDHRAAVVAYDISSSVTACNAVVAALRKFGIDVVYENLAIPVPASGLTAAVQRMKQDGVDYIASCMDISGDIQLAHKLAQAGISNIPQLWLDGYSVSAVHTYGSLMNDVYVFNSNVPFEAAAEYPGMAAYINTLHKYFPTARPSEVSLAGWASADLFVQGLRAIGRDVTRTRLISAINNMTDFTANGILPPVNWKYNHSGEAGWECNSFLKAVDGHFHPVFGSSSPRGRSVFTCFDMPQPATNKLVPIPLPPGVPLASTSGSTG